jgi:hypothetical protein
MQRKNDTDISVNKATAPNCKNPRFGYGTSLKEIAAVSNPSIPVHQNDLTVSFTSKPLSEDEAMAMLNQLECQSTIKLK